MSESREIVLRSDFSVDVVEHSGSDEMICKAARVSTLGAESINTEESSGLIRFLMSNRHGSPFEHGMFTFRISAPIFVWREFMRHRIGFSYNEQSGRYMVLEGTFYVPPPERPLVQVGKPGHYEFVPGTPEQHEELVQDLVETYELAWAKYNKRLARGDAKEVARIVLPVSTYSTAYVTCNPRSLMSFLSLRTKHEDSMFPSYPQWEIEQVALLMEEAFSSKLPLTHAAFMSAGRVSP